MTGPILDVQDLGVRYRGSPANAVDGVTFTAEPGEILGFLGPSGAGKSTVQKVLTRLLRNHSGTVTAFGRPLSRWRSNYFDHVGVSFELPAQFGKLTARENLTAFARFYSGTTEHPDQLLEWVGLTHAARQRADTFSKGMRLRLNLARALLNRPALLFLDEPTSGQDPVHAARIRQLIREQADLGRTVFLTTHDMTSVDELCDRVAFLSQGKIAALDSPRQLKLLHGRPGVMVEYRDEGRLLRREFPLATLGTDPTFAELAHRGIETIHTREATLDQVFATVTEERL